MSRSPGRPADQLHRRTARMLHALSARPLIGVHRDELMSAMGLEPTNKSDEKKFRRDLAALRAAGWHIDTIERENVFTYRLRVVDPRIRTTFTDDQRAQLLRAAERAGLGQLYDDLDPSRSEGTAGMGPPGLGNAQHAIRHRCLLSLSYRGSERVVDPYDVYFASNAWYLRGKEEGTDLPFKTFRLDRASDLRTHTPGTASPVPELPAPNRDPMLQVVGEPVDAVLAVGRDDLPDAIALLGANGHRQLGVAPEGRALIEVRVTNLDAFLARLFEMDTRVRLVGPDSARDRAREVLSAFPGGAR